MSNALNLGSVVLPGDGYPSIHAFQIPEVAGLEGAFFFGDGLSLIGKNFAPGKPDATVKGSPVKGAFGGIELGLNNYIDTGIVDSANMTVISVFRDIPATGNTVKSGLIGNNLSLATGGIGMYRNENGLTVSGTSIKLVGTTPTLENASVNIVSGAYTLMALRARNLAASTSNNLTSGALANGSLTGARTIGPNSIWIGRLPNASFSSTHEQLMAMVFSRALTDVELNLVAAHAKKYCASKGFTV